MCAVSAVIGTLPQFSPIEMWPLQPLQDLSEVIRRLDAIDKKMGAKDCHEPTKVGVLRKIEDRLADLERRVDQVID